MAANTRQGIVVNQPKTDVERSKVATTCVSSLHLSLPCIQDGIDNKVEAAYSGWPDRLYIIGADGKIAYKGQPGPRGFIVSDMTTKLSEMLDKK
jgi:type I thyroxine 5'-deiodinase